MSDKNWSILLRILAMYEAESFNTWAVKVLFVRFLTARVLIEISNKVWKKGVFFGPHAWLVSLNPWNKSCVYSTIYKEWPFVWYCMSRDLTTLYCLFLSIQWENLGWNLCTCFAFPSVWNSSIFPAIKDLKNFVVGFWHSRSILSVTTTKCWVLRPGALFQSTFASAESGFCYKN